MSTNSIISIIHENKTVESKYCHYDSYPEYTGIILDKSFSDIDSVIKLFQINRDIKYFDESGKVYYFDDEEISSRFFDSIDDCVIHYSNNYIDYYYFYSVKYNKWYVYDKKQHKLIKIKEYLAELKKRELYNE